MSSAHAPGEGPRHVVFSLGEELFAVPIGVVQEVLPLPSITPVPRAPRWLLGVINRRGNILGVVDIRDVLSCEDRDATNAARLLVVTTERFTLALKVDSVEEIVGIHSDETIPAETSHARSTFVARAHVRGGRLISLLDLEPILNRDEFLVFQ